MIVSKYIKAETSMSGWATGLAEDVETAIQRELGSDYEAMSVSVTSLTAFDGGTLGVLLTMVLRERS
jgi:hypothetical protein